MDGNVLISSKIFPKLSSDHHPISLLLEEEENLGPILFWFNPLWIEREGFWDIITQVWSHFIVGSPSFIWEQMIKLTKIALKNWIKTPLSNPSRIRVETVQALGEIQFCMESVDVSKSQLVIEQVMQDKSSLYFLR